MPTGRSGIVLEPCDVANKCGAAQYWVLNHAPEKEPRESGSAFSVDHAC